MHTCNISFWHTQHHQDTTSKQLQRVATVFLRQFRCNTINNASDRNLVKKLHFLFCVSVGGESTYLATGMGAAVAALVPVGVPSGESTYVSQGAWRSVSDTTQRLIALGFDSYWFRYLSPSASIHSAALRGRMNRKRRCAMWIQFAGNQMLQTIKIEMNINKNNQLWNQKNGFVNSMLWQKQCQKMKNKTIWILISLIN